MPAVQPPFAWNDEFDLPAVPNVLTQRSLLVEVVGDGSTRTAIRVDSEVVWLPAKPAAERIPAGERANANAVLAVLLASLVERNEEKIVFGGAANLAAHDFSQGLREVLEALEEQVVLMRLLGEATEPAILTVRIGAENEVAGLQTTSVVSTGYGNASQPLAKLGVLGPTRMDYPSTMGAVRAVARYVGQILAES